VVDLYAVKSIAHGAHPPGAREEPIDERLRERHRAILAAMPACSQSRFRSQDEERQGGFARPESAHLFVVSAVTLRSVMPNDRNPTLVRVIVVSPGDVTAERTEY
jgi:hypothetical protein